MRRAKRKPIRKFTERKFSRARLERLTYQPDYRYGYLFEAAHGLVKMPNPEKAVFIFLGQGMRPLFEAVRAINEIELSHTRKTFRYVVTPTFVSIPAADKDAALAKTLAERRIVSRKTNVYYIVDWRARGENILGAARAIKSINPLAEVKEINQRIGQFYIGITDAETIPVPTVKNRFGKVVGMSNSAATNEYLHFQKALHDHIDELRRKKQVK